MSTPDEAERPPAAERVIGTVTATARLLIPALGGLYTAGLLIVNIDLARYGVSNLDLARPEYVMAGALWTLSTVPFGIVAVIFSRLAIERRGGLFAAPLAFLIFGIALPAIVLSLVFSVPQAPYLAISSTVVMFHAATMLINVGLATVFATFLWEGVQRFLRASNGMSRLLNAGFATIMTILALSLMVGSYSVFSFPFLKREFGGGYKSVVELVLVEQAPASWDSFGLPISSDRSRIGPVFLLFESQNGFFVTRWLAPPLLDVRLEQLGPYPTFESVAIERKAVAVVVYKGPGTRND